MMGKNVHEMVKLNVFLCKWGDETKLVVVIVLLLLVMNVSTLALGSQPRQRHGKVQVESATWESHSHSRECDRVWGNEPTHFQVNSHFGNWNPCGLLIFQRVISKVKTHWIEKFLIPLESSWGLDVRNGFAWSI
jgi:hypothetical protein